MRVPATRPPGSRRCLSVLILATVALIIWSGSAAADTDRVMREQMRDIDTQPLGEFIDDLQRNMQGELPALDLPSVIERLRQGEGVFPWRELGRILIRQFGGVVVENAGTIGQLLILALLASLLTQVERAWGQETVSQVARAVIYLALAAVAVTSLGNAFATARGTVQRLSDIMLAMLPTLTTLLAASGAFTSAAIMHPAVIFVCHGVVQVIARIVLPMLLASVMLQVAVHFAPDKPLARMSGFLRQLTVWTLQISMVVFLGVVTIQGAAGAVTDGVTLRSLKFAAQSFIPVLGSMFSDAGELVMSSSVLLKNAAGFVGMGVVALTAALPLMRLAALMLIYRGAAALAAPLGSEEISDLLDLLGEGIALLTAAVAAVALMFYITITIVIGAGNTAVMLR